MREYILKAHNAVATFEQRFKSKKEYNKKARSLRMMGFIIDGEKVH